MSLTNKTTVKFYVSVILLIVITMITSMAHAQKEYTTISKNINPEARSLYHDLSPQGDSLYLKSESIFYKVTFLNSLDRKVYKFNPPVLEGKIPLHDIIVGDYTVLVYQKDRIIVFHISRLLEIEIPSEIIASKDIAITQEIPIVKPVLSIVIPKEKSINKAISSKIKINKKFELSAEEMEAVMSETKLDVNDIVAENSPRPYNLTSINRKNMQSRSEYRRNNLRPNGKPYH